MHVTLSKLGSMQLYVMLWMMARVGCALAGPMDPAPCGDNHPVGVREGVYPIIMPAPVGTPTAAATENTTFHLTTQQVVGPLASAWGDNREEPSITFPAENEFYVSTIEDLRLDVPVWREAFLRVRNLIIEDPQGELLRRLASFYQVADPETIALEGLSAFDFSSVLWTSEGVRAWVRFLDTLTLPNLNAIAFADNALARPQLSSSGPWSGSDSSAPDLDIVTTFAGFLERHRSLNALQIMYSGQPLDRDDYPDVSPILEQIEAMAHLTRLDLSASLILGTNPRDNLRRILGLRLPSLTAFYWPQLHMWADVDWVADEGLPGLIEENLRYHSTLVAWGVDLRMLDLDNFMHAFRNLRSLCPQISHAHLYYQPASPIFGFGDVMPFLSENQLRSISWNLLHHVHNLQTKLKGFFVGGQRIHGSPVVIEAGNQRDDLRLLTPDWALRLLTALAVQGSENVFDTPPGPLFRNLNQAALEQVTTDLQVDIAELRALLSMRLIPSFRLRDLSLRDAIIDFTVQWEFYFPRIAIMRLWEVYDLFLQTVVSPNFDDKGDVDARFYAVEEALRRDLLESHRQEFREDVGYLADSEATRSSSLVSSEIESDHQSDTDNQSTSPINTPHFLIKFTADMMKFLSQFLPAVDDDQDFSSDVSQDL